MDRADASFGWLLDALGHELTDTWPGGRSWRRGATYIVLESGPDLLPGGPSHHAAYLENDDGFEVELVASPE